MCFTNHGLTSESWNDGPPRSRIAGKVFGRTPSDAQTDDKVVPLRDIVLDLGMRPRAFFGPRQLVLLDDNCKAVVERADLDGIISALESRGCVRSYRCFTHSR